MEGKQPVITRSILEESPVVLRCSPEEKNGYHDGSMPVRAGPLHRNR
jgi:hypothetical protein